MGYNKNPHRYLRKQRGERQNSPDGFIIIHFRTNLIVVIICFWWRDFHMNISNEWSYFWFGLNWFLSSVCFLFTLLHMSKWMHSFKRPKFWISCAMVSFMFLLSACIFSLWQWGSNKRWLKMLCDGVALSTSVTLSEQTLSSSRSARTGLHLSSVSRAPAPTQTLSSISRRGFRILLLANHPDPVRDLLQKGFAFSVCVSTDFC